MSAKGQVFSSDFFVGLTIFLIGLSILIIFWNYTNYKIRAKRAVEDLSRLALSISNVFFIEGEPKYWNPENVVILGFSNDGRLNWTKINYMKEIGYEKTRKMLSCPYHLQLRIINATNDFLIFNLTKEGISDAEFVAKAERYGILNSSIVRIEVIVWR